MMGDLIDRANDTADTFLSAALSARRDEAPSATGACLFCRKPVPPPARWCDAGCRDDWEKASWAKRNAAVEDDD